MIANLRNVGVPDGTEVELYVPLVSGATVGAGNFIATEKQNVQSWQGVAPGPFGGELGTTLYFSAIVRDDGGAATIRLAPLNVQETYLGGNFGTAPLGGNYRSVAVGVTAANTLVKELYSVGVGFSAQWSGAGTNQAKRNSAIADIQALAERATQVCYSLGEFSGCGTVIVWGVQEVIPEPGTWALMGAGLALLRRRK